MLLRHIPASHPRTSEITPEHLFHSRRRFLSQATAAGLVSGFALTPQQGHTTTTPDLAPLEAGKNPLYQPDEEITPYEDASTYNNFYEFGTGKGDPVRNSGNFKPRPWTVKVEGEVKGVGEYDFESLIKRYPLEERIYRLRCVEAWSMVIPWIGFPLAAWIRDLEPHSAAKYVQFVTLYDPEQMPGQRRPVLNWPYVEGLRLDEAMNPLTLMAVGMYGRILPKQNGAPIRLVVPWKYGFKSIKSIVLLRFTTEQPRTSWNENARHEYGFYANVNPQVDHPRWDQSRERRIGDFLKRPTLMFNGYAEEVANLYQGMNLAEYF